MTYINEGQKPFEYTQNEGEKLSSKELRKKLRILNRKHSGLKGLSRKRKKPCPECGRRTKCKHRAEGYKAPALIISWITCTNCQATVRAETTYCHHCGVYEPKKPRLRPQVEPKKEMAKVTVCDSTEFNNVIEGIEPKQKKKEPRKKKEKKEKITNEK